MEVSYARSLECVPAAEWRRLAERAGHVFATPDWLLTWWRHYGRGSSPLVGLARAGGELAAILPLHESRACGLPLLRFIGHGPSDSLGPVCAPLGEPAASAVVGEAIRALPLRRFVLLAEQVPGDQVFDRAAGARFLYRQTSLVLHVEAESWDEFLQQRSPNFRRQVRGFPRRLAELGAISYRLASDPERLPRDLDALFRLHRMRWGSARTPFLLAEPFHREFADRALRQGWLRLWLLELDGRPVAALHGFRFAGSECFYQAGRDPSFRHEPLGFVLLAHALRRALSDGIRDFRFGRGDDSYKRRFGSSGSALNTYGLPRGASARLALAAATAVRGRSLGLRRILDR